MQLSAASKLLMNRAQYRLRCLTLNEFLLLTRSAHEICYPNVFELPIGNVDDNDISLKHALAREVEEETGLGVSRVIAELPNLLYHPEKQVLNGDGTARSIRKSCVQLKFVVEVEGDVIRVNLDEHSVRVWATRREVEGLEMTDGMRSVVVNPLTWKESHTDQFWKSV